MRKRFFYLDVLRVTACFLVMYAHFVSVGMNATTIPNVIADASLPLLPRTYLTILDIKLIQIFNTQAGVFGVGLFFMVTGFLMPLMMERYTRAQFLCNRFFRIFPTLVFCVLLCGFSVYITQGITFSLKVYICSFLLIYPIVGCIPVIGILWTLVIECLFYIITAVVGKLTFAKLMTMQISLLLFIAYAVSSAIHWLHS